MSTTVAFRHPFFGKNADGTFRLAETDRRPVYVIDLGDQAGVVAFDAIRQELALGDYGDDEAMLTAVAEGLHFIESLRLGDDLPSEIITGAASWRPAARDGKTANGRVVAHLVKWHEGHDDAIARPLHLQRYLAAQVDRPAISRALKQLDAQVGSQVGGMAGLDPILKNIAAELAYIEALRHTVERVRRIRDILVYMGKIGGGQANDTQEVAAVLRVFNHMMLFFDQQLAAVDKRICDMPAAVADTASLFEYLADVRNQLRRKLLVWEGQLTLWEGIRPSTLNLVEVAPKVSALYRFLAPQYSPVDQWARAQPFRHGVAPHGHGASAAAVTPRAKVADRA